MKYFAVFPALLCLVLAGCGGSGSTSSTPAANTTPQATFNLTGDWQITATSTVRSGSSVMLLGALTQSGTVVSGILHVLNSSCYDFITDVPVKGFTNSTSSKFSFTSDSVAGQVITAQVDTGSLSNGDSLTGTYTISGGCAAGDAGTASGTKVPTLTGTWTGSAQSTSGGAPVPITATLQETPASDGGFVITGSMTFTNSPCSTSADITGGVNFGGYFTLNVTTHDIGGGTGAGNINGNVTDPSTAKHITATYGFGSGTCSGDGGTITLSR